MKKTKFKADNLWSMAIDEMDSLEGPADARKRNLTTIFFYELEKRIQNKELININITGPVRTGKSTVAMALCIEIKKWIKKHHNETRPMGNKNILRDQNEYSRLVKRRPETFKHECDVIDEWAEMEMSGYNATVEEKYLKDFSDRQAARYYHRIACSPGNVTDRNSDILLQTVPGSRNGGKTLLHLSYRISNGDMSQPIIIGYIEVHVQKTIEAHWYNEYLHKKEAKWELMNKHNVRSPRELEYAQIILATYNRMAAVAKLGLNKRKHFKMALLEEADKRGVWFSIIGDKDVLETLEGMGETLQLIHETEQKIKHIETGANKGKITYTVIKDMEQYKTEIKSNLARTIERLHKLSDLWEAYQKIDEIEEKELWQ